MQIRKGKQKIKTEMEKEKERRKSHLDLLCPQQPTSTAHQKPSFLGPAQPNQPTIPLRQKNKTEELVLIFFTSGGQRDAVASFSLALAPSPRPTV
jgi:hypothetical protein